jgi:steroid delta-isomerase-like uncharacterized protein
VGAEENKAIVRGFVDEVANAHDTSRIAEFLADDFRLPPGEDGLNRDGLAAVLSYYFSAFSDLHYTVEDMVAEGDSVITRATMAGTHDGVYDGQPATGRGFQVDEVDVFTVRDGRIVDYRIVWDELSFRRQLGLPLA